MISAGRINKRVSIEQPTATQDDYGAQVVTWSEWAERWVSIEPVSAKESERAKRYGATVSHKLTMRYIAGLTPDMRINFGGRIFAISGIINEREANESVTVFASEQVQA